VYGRDGRGSGHVAERNGSRVMRPRTELRLPAESIAPALARAGIRGMTRELPERVAADLALLVTEVVSNSVEHGTGSVGDEIVVRVYVDEVIRVEVDDLGPGFDAGEPAEPENDAASGWGLYLLTNLSSRWGVDTSDRTTTVWFELDPRIER
jgi:anti-sigma regulatory factor (Ser/Thr protein kinase)